MISAKPLAIVGLLALSSCGSGSGGGSTPGSSSGGNAELLAVHHGRIVDVYGLRTIDGRSTFSLYRTDVLVGPDIADERQAGDDKVDQDILYDFISADTETLQPRLFIPRDIDSADFRDAFDAVDDQARLVGPARFGQAGPDTVFSVVPRNASIRLTFAEGLGIEDGFFVQRDASGNVIGLRNSEAVQLLKIVGDPTDSEDVGDFEVMPIRVAFSLDSNGQVATANQLIIDPVLLGAEGLQYQTRNNASGMPEAPDQIGANIRIAVALEGPLAIPGVREDSFGDLTGKNNSGQRSVIRDLRSGNREDESSDISRGFIRDPIPPRIVGEIPFFVERVDDVNQFTQEVTVFKNGITHEIDRGDVLRFVPPDGSGVAVAVTEVILDPLDDQGRPATQHVRVRVRKVARIPNDQGQLIDPIEDLDPSDDPEYPDDPGELDAWLVMNAARAILVTEFTASRIDPVSERVVRDDPRNFITFSPTPLLNADGTISDPSENISPFAGAIIKLTKPVDLTTVKSTDSLFFATRNLVDPAEIAAFQAEGGRGEGSKSIGNFRMAKFRTPHLVASRLFDEDGSQTALRLQPILGFFLNNKMRADLDKPFEEKEYKYYLHLISGLDGITDLSGNPIDLQAVSVDDSEQIVIPFTLDVRMRTATEPLFTNNIAISIVRTYNDPDEDEQPSYYQKDEVQGMGEAPIPAAESVKDIFGAVIYLESGVVQSRPTTRTRHIVDNLNQLAPPPQNTDFRWCPERLMTFGFAGDEQQIATSTAATAFGQGIQNPLNPFGCRLQTVWREIDMGLSRVDPFDFNLDVEQMYWAPFTGRPIRFDVFDRVSMFLGHSEKRPEPCVGATSSLPSMSRSGLEPEFATNYLKNNLPLSRDKESGPAPHPGYVDATMVIDPSQAITEPTGIHRYLPLPAFQKPYFVWRDETVVEQGGETGVGRDVTSVDLPDFNDYIISPFLGGYGASVARGTLPGTLEFNQGTWTNAQGWQLIGGLRDIGSAGLMSPIALPLLADFWTYCDSPALPAGNGFIAAGTNGWQISLSVQSNFLPAFRTFSGGFAGSGAKPPECVDPSSSKWNKASGGFTPAGDVPMVVTFGSDVPLVPDIADNSIYWIMADFVKRTTVVTTGFVDIINPHRVSIGSADTRLGPYFLPSEWRPNFTHSFQPALESLPGGTAVDVEFRGASIVDPEPWRASQEGYTPVPTPKNFSLDPLKAGDAGIRKFDNRPTGAGGTARNWWTYFYNRTVTSYTDNLNTLMNPAFTDQFAGPFEEFRPEDVRYFNWRFLMTNNVEASPPISPTIDTFMVTYRFELER
jgi:hypothetical protein